MNRKFEAMNFSQLAPPQNKHCFETSEDEPLCCLHSRTRKKNANKWMLKVAYSTADEPPKKYEILIKTNQMEHSKKLFAKLMSSSKRDKTQTESTQK
jgi:hypothetical protein